MLSRRLIRLVALLVPSAVRAQWREEWLAELEASGDRWIDPRATGAFRDAWSVRAVRGGQPIFGAIGDDVRSGLRQLRRSPGNSLVAIVIVALGTGFTAALFSVVYGVFLKPWPVESPDRLAFVYQNQASGWRYPAHLLGRGSRVVPERDIDGVERAAGSMGRHANVGIGEVTHQLYGESITASYFDVLGVTPSTGRVFRPDEESEANTSWLIVISHHLWTKYFDSSPDAIGRRVVVNKHPATIIGVMPEGFRGITSVWEHSDWWMLRAQLHPNSSVSTILRMKPGVTLAQLQASLDVHGRIYSEQLRARRPELALPPHERTYPTSLLSDLRIPQDPQDMVIPERIASALVAVVLAVLVIAVINLTSLLVARGISRAPELATRRVLGVTPARLARQLMTESLVLSAVGAGAGVGVAALLIDLFTALTPSRYPIDASLDWRVAVVSLGVAAGIALVVSVSPIRQALRGNVLPTLAAGSNASTPRRNTLRYAVVVPQIALSLLLLVAAGVHVKALSDVELVDRGYRVDGVTVLNLRRDGPTADPRGPRRPDAEVAAEYQQVYRSLFEVIRAFPALRAGLMRLLPLESTKMPDLAAADGADPQVDGATIEVQRVGISPGALEALGIRLVDGRDFDDRDTRSMRAVAIVSEATARRLWPGRRAIGQRLGVFSPQQSEPKTDWYEVAGVARDTHAVLARPDDPVKVYTSLEQEWRPWAYYLVVGSDPAAPAVGQLRSRIDGVDPFTSVVTVRAMTAAVDDLLYPRRLAATVLSAAGLTGLGLACMGLYGVIALSVGQRLRELGIRAALGATRADLVTLVLGEGGRLAVLGSIIGFGGAVLALRGTAHLAEGVPTTDWLIFATVPLVLAAIVALACLGPARRAARVDPVSVLKA